MATRMLPVSWVSPLLYAVVAASGLYYQAVDRGLGSWRTGGFVLGLALLGALEVAERRRAARAVPLLLARGALIGAVTALDVSGLSQVLFVLLPFTAYFSFGRAAALALGGLCLAGPVAAFTLSDPGWYRDEERVSDVLMLGVGLVFALAMAAVAVGEQHARERMAEYAARVAELSAAAERTRLARDIHDSLGHHLTAISVQLQLAASFRGLDPDSAERAVGEARRSVTLALGDVREAVRTLRGEAVRPSLSAGLAALAREGGGPPVEVEVTGSEEGYDAAALTALYRAAQEGITNARRHAGASRVTVTVRLAADAARLVVADDGRGFAPSRNGDGDGDGNGNGNGFGLLGMRERVHLVAGSVEIDSEPGRGTRLTVTVPARERVA